MTELRQELEKEKATNHKKKKKVAFIFKTAKINLHFLTAIR